MGSTKEQGTKAKLLGSGICFPRSGQPTCLLNALSVQKGVESLGCVSEVHDLACFL